MNDGLSQEARKSANMDGERATLAPNSCEEAWHKYARMSEDVKEVGFGRRCTAGLQALRFLQDCSC
jgi:hypothetical protein